uniref:Uncharacterized protein n=1 Tax=Glossina austeni TaxID=7395 RepID=A0A1A9V1P6_GLOAU
MAATGGAAATSVVVLDRGNNTTCTINLHGDDKGITTCIVALYVILDLSPCTVALSEIRTLSDMPNSYCFDLLDKTDNENTNLEDKKGKSVLTVREVCELANRTRSTMWVELKFCDLICMLCKTGIENVNKFKSYSSATVVSWRVNNQEQLFCQIDNWDPFSTILLRTLFRLLINSLS